MVIPRPDLTQLPPEVREYIEFLEAEVERLRPLRRPRPAPPAEEEAPLALSPIEPNEPPTTVQVITITASGQAKRTPRHLYSRQHRGGMGIFDLEIAEDDRVAALLTADASQSLILFTNLARAFRLPVGSIVETPVHGRGQPVNAKITLLEGEHFVAALPDKARGAVALVSATGFVRHLRHHVFGEYMKPGTSLFDARKNGELTAVCRTTGDGDLLIVTRHGKGIRFAEKLVPPQGEAGIRLEAGDRPVAIGGVDDDGLVFLATADGRGTLRSMTSFTANKSAGGGGKIVMQSDQVAAAVIASEGDDLLMISRLTKIIRFPAGEVPVKDSAIQGVSCMSLRGDEVVAVARAA